MTKNIWVKKVSNNIGGGKKHFHLGRPKNNFKYLKNKNVWEKKVWNKQYWKTITFACISNNDISDPVKSFLLSLHNLKQQLNRKMCEKKKYIETCKNEN